MNLWCFITGTIQFDRFQLENRIEAQCKRDFRFLRQHIIMN